MVSGGPFKVRVLGGPDVEDRPRRRAHPPNALTPRSGHRDDPRLEHPAALDPAIVRTRSRLQPSVRTQPVSLLYQRSQCARHMMWMKRSAMSHG